MKTVVMSIANQKGGVGKTTTAFNIGAGLAKRGKKVLLVDCDPQGNLTEYLGCENTKLNQILTMNDILQDHAMQAHKVNINNAIRASAEGVDYIPADISLSSAEIYMATAFCREQMLNSVLTPIVTAATYDYIIIDCLPSLGVLLINALAASDKVIIPVQAQKFALDGLHDFFNIFTAVKRNLNPKLDVEGLLLTMADNTNMAKAVAAALPSQYPNANVFETTISKSIEAANSTHMQKSLVAMNSKLGKQYLSLVDEILSEVRQ